ncbi:MAG: DUF1344 domain-containing protein [Candidatus Rokubacteria bacterium]|nr:DUF1344 domain-containing protein [Candidatus Rokubacteria bacterium]
MKRTIVLITILALLLFVGWVETMAQTKPQPAPPAAGAPAEKPETPGVQKELRVEGKIKSVDASGKEVTLEDGTKLMIPDRVKVRRDALKEGAMIRASYEEKDGQKVVTRIIVQPPKS